MKKQLEIRKPDAYGGGHFNATRGSRLHKGVDIVATPGEPWESLNDGKVTKLGYPYGDDLAFRYVEVTDGQGWKWRYFYIEPLALVKVGTVVKKGDVIGTVQTLQKRYPKITEHVHFEIMNGKQFVNPTPLIQG